MITNERQHKITRSKAHKFRLSLSKLSEGLNEANLLEVAQRNALRSQLDDLEEQIADYEALRSGSKRVIQVDSIEQLPRVLVQARAAAGLSQRDLAESLGLKEQQIQRYESTLYSSASVDRLLKVIDALGVEISNEVILNADKKSVNGVLKRAEAVGLPKAFLLKRLLPQGLAASATGARYQAGVLAAMVQRLERVYGWPADLLLSAQPLQLSAGAFNGLAFKVPKNASEKKLAAYTVYANYLALAVLDAVDVPVEPIPKTPDEFRKQVERSYGELTLSTTLRYAWDHGVAVLPLSDGGAFHGACWRIGKSSVVVLKQKTKSVARWLFDLIHELRHTQQNLDQETYAVIENVGRADEEREVDANRFAGDVVLDGRAEDLVQACKDDASGKIQFLKNAVLRVAGREGVDIAQLANYLAFRLALQGEDWWGTAANLQPKVEDPWEIARDVFLERFDFSRLGDFDRDLVARALEREGN